jgi:hypothetical protein
VTYEGVRQLNIDSAGNLVLDGGLIQRKPYVYQDVNGRRQEVRGSYQLVAANRVAFQLDAYDQSRELVIDPTFNLSTYLGGTQAGAVTAVAYDAANSQIHATGQSSSTDFPTPGGTTIAGLTKSGLVDASVVSTELDRNTEELGNVFRRQPQRGRAITFIGTHVYIAGAIRRPITCRARARPRWAARKTHSWPDSTIRTWAGWEAVWRIPAIWVVRGLSSDTESPWIQRRTYMLLDRPQARRCPAPFSEP